MELVKLGKRGQVSIPTALLRRLGLEGDSWLIADAAEDGAIVLRPAGVYPIEIYSDERIREFKEEGRMTDEEWAQVEEVLKRR
jgi:bifunctional DNA-binding transcriptional regulator/antitoxin component of YhaV-PrlF toxin-antitoxin module